MLSKTRAARWGAPAIIMQTMYCTVLYCSVVVGTKALLWMKLQYSAETPSTVPAIFVAVALARSGRYSAQFPSAELLLLLFVNLCIKLVLYNTVLSCTLSIQFAANLLSTSCCCIYCTVLLFHVRG